MNSIPGEQISGPLYTIEIDTQPICPEASQSISVYRSLLDELDEKMTIEEKKYPLTEREKILVETIRELLHLLDTIRR